MISSTEGSTASTVTPAPASSPPACRPAASGRAPSSWKRRARTPRARVGDQPAAPDHDQVLGGQRHLAHQVRGDEHRAAFGGQLLEQVAHPLDALRVKAVDRLVEHHGVGIAEQRRGDPEALSHAERERAGALARDLVESDHLDQLAHPGAADPVRLRERQQVVVGGPPGVDRARLEQRADLVQGRGMVAVGLAVDRACARRRGRRAPGSAASWSTCPTRWARGSP